MSRRRLKVIVEADGGSRGNPGPAGYGAVVCEAATGEVLVTRAESIGTATNNVAEYSGLIAGLRAAAELGAVDVEVRMDSKLVVEQMSGRWQIKHPGLRPLAAQAAALATTFGSVRYTWVPRERNARADALANEAMSSASSSAPSAPESSAASALLAGVPRSWSPPSTSGATRLVLVRHGETTLTAQRRYSGRGDVPLSARGIEQALAAAQRVSTVVLGPPVIVTSPLSRCVETAAAIAAALSAGSSAASLPASLVYEPRIEPGLIECDFGEWEGLTFAEVRERWRDQMDEWLASTSVAPPGGESFVDVGTRVRSVVSGLLADHPGETVVVVSHVTPIKLILRDALAAGDAFLHRLFLDPAGISIVDTWPDAHVAVRTVNDTSHLG